jgi:hypothetical protein
MYIDNIQVILSVLSVLRIGLQAKTEVTSGFDRRSRINSSGHESQGVTTLTIIH